MAILLLLLLLSFLFDIPTMIICSQQEEELYPNPCNETCGHLSLPFPFHLNSSCGPPIPSFRLSCRNNSLQLGPADLLVVSFLPSGSLLLDYIDSSTCDRRSYPASMTSSVFHDLTPNFFAVTSRNVFRLYDCDDSSVCRTDGCNADCRGNYSAAVVGCCYPLSDGTVWKPGDDFRVFSEFGCRGFSSWAGVDDGMARRGIEVEWAVPKGFGGCAEGAAEVKATAVRDGVRCVCGEGFLGDGFAAGAGCFKFCRNSGSRTYSGNCCKERLCKKKVDILVGTVIFLFFSIVVVSCYFLLRGTTKAKSLNSKPPFLSKIFAKTSRARLFTYQELNKATQEFDHDQQLVDVPSGTIHPGVLIDGSLVAVQRVKCGTQQNLRHVLKKTEITSQISHKNIARVIGWCTSADYTLLVVHEFYPNGTLRELLHPCSANGALAWYRRINIATEVASALTHLQYSELFPIVRFDLKSSDIFIDADYSIKIAGFRFINVGHVVESCDSFVYSFSLVLLELIVGSDHANLEEMVHEKMKEKSFHEIVDPSLKFGEQFHLQHEQMERLANFALLCLSLKGLSMVEVAKEFIDIVNDNCQSNGLEPTLEVTFSTSSLLQMISVSPDSLYIP